MLLRIVPIGNISPQLLEAMASGIRETARVRSKIMQPLQLPQDTFNRWKKQYDAVKILEILTQNREAQTIDKELPTLFVTDADVFYDRMNFLFGAYEPDKNCIMISTARLKTEYYEQRPNQLILTERTVKEAIHQVGHYLGFEHCKYSSCIMYHSGSAGEIDKQGNDFCRECKIRAQMRGINLEL